MNKIFVIGRLINDPEQHITQNGVHQSKIVIADNKSKDETNFFNCIA
jgi:single-stranded DNA-binding protein